MNSALANVAAKPNELRIVGREVRRDLNITFHPDDRRFVVALYLKGKGRYSHTALATGERPRLSPPMYSGDTHSFWLDSAGFELTTKEADVVRDWLATLPQGGAK